MSSAGPIDPSEIPKNKNQSSLNKSLHDPQIMTTDALRHSLFRRSTNMSTKNPYLKFVKNTTDTNMSISTINEDQQEMMKNSARFNEAKITGRDINPAATTKFLEIDISSDSIHGS